MKRTAFLVARSIFVLFWLTTAVYCVIAFVPFTYVEVIQFEVVPALTVFARLHPYLFWIAWVAGLFSLREELRQRATRGGILGFASVSFVAGVALLVHPLLASLPNDESSLRLGFVALVPLVWVAIIDLRSYAGKLAWSQPTSGDDRRFFHASLGSAVFLTALYFGIFLVRFAGDATTGLSGPETARAAVVSLLTHLVIFMGVFAVVSVIRSLAALFPSPPRAELNLLAVAATAGCAIGVSSLVLGAVSLSGRPSLAVAFALAIVLSHLGICVRLFAASGRSATSGIALFFAPMAPGPGAGRLARVLCLAALAASAWACVSATAIMDWNFLLQKVSALLVWILAYAAFLAAAPFVPGRSRPMTVYLGACVVALCVFKGLGAWEGGRPPAQDQYAGRDPSFKLLSDLLKRPHGASSRDDKAFYRYVQERTNIPRSVHIEPVDVKFVPAITPAPGPKPNIFIFVIDSLRRDYLSPYNPAVTFTPVIDEFAKDSVVFTNAFSRYGGTGLSEPSIWVGGMMPHQQYVTPFHPWNALQKLVDAEGYTSFVSIDTILRLILEPDPKTVEIDRGVLTHDLKLARSLQDLASRLRSGEAEGRPAFAYAQPQDLHISTIAREGASLPAGETFPGFYAPYAARLKAADAGFGEFVAALRKLGLYDDSIIVLTSDHGDSLGEDGRWGHAYTIFPEILRIPLIIHLPPALRSRVASRPTALAFLTDITPSLYALLGHEPELRNGVFGRPLFEARSRDLPSAERAEGNFLVASSYGPVYGLLGENGRTLYIADAVNYADHFYDMNADPAAAPVVLSEEQRARYRDLIRESVDAIHAFYRVPSTH